MGVALKVGGPGTTGGGNVFKEAAKVNTDKTKVAINKLPGANTTSPLFPVDDTADPATEEGAKAAIIGVGNLGKHTECPYEVGTIATFAAFSAVSVRCTEKPGVDVATVEGTEVGGYTGKPIITIPAC